MGCLRGEGAHEADSMGVTRRGDICISILDSFLSSSLRSIKPTLRPFPFRSWTGNSFNSPAWIQRSTSGVPSPNTAIPFFAGKGVTGSSCISGRSGEGVRLGSSENLGERRCRCSTTPAAGRGGTGGIGDGLRDAEEPTDVLDTRERADSLSDPVRDTEEMVLAGRDFVDAVDIDDSVLDSRRVREVDETVRVRRGGSFSLCDVDGASSATEASRAAEEVVRVRDRTSAALGEETGDVLVSFTGEPVVEALIIELFFISCLETGDALSFSSLTGLLAAPRIVLRDSICIEISSLRLMLLPSGSRTGENTFFVVDPALLSFLCKETADDFRATEGSRRPVDTLATFLGEGEGGAAGFTADARRPLALVVTSLVAFATEGFILVSGAPLTFLWTQNASTRQPLSLTAMLFGVLSRARKSKISNFPVSVPT